MHIPLRDHAPKYIYRNIILFNIVCHDLNQSIHISCSSVSPSISSPSLQVKTVGHMTWILSMLLVLDEKLLFLCISRPKVESQIQFLLIDFDA